MNFFYATAVVMLVCVSCTFTDKFSLNSPQKDRELIFEWVNTLVPDEEAFIKVYSSNSKRDFVKVRSIMDFPIHIYWGDTIKIRGCLLVGDTNIQVINSQIDWMMEYTDFEKEQVKNNMPNWEHYYLSRIATGYYEKHPSE